MEDSVCAGKLITEITKLNNSAELSDSSKACVSLSKTFGKSTLKMLKDTEHGKILLENGFEDDLNFCSKNSSYNVIPYFSANVLKVLSNSEDVNK